MRFPEAPHRNKRRTPPLPQTNGNGNEKKNKGNTSALHGHAERAASTQNSPVPAEIPPLHYHLHFTPLSERERRDIRAEDPWENYAEAAKKAYAERLRCIAERIGRLRSLHNLTTIRILPEPLPYSNHGTWILEASPEEIAAFSAGLDRRIASTVGPVNDASAQKLTPAHPSRFPPSATRLS